jgi:hypothetical protein
MGDRPIKVEARENQTPLEATTEFFLKPSALAANAINAFGNSIAKDHIDFQCVILNLEGLAQQIRNGDLGEIENILFSQSVALNAIFSSMLVKASRQDYISSANIFMSLALKAQNQSRATLQTLMQLKKPNQTAFIKQTNIAHGHQQVNNEFVESCRQDLSNLSNELLGSK